MIKLTLKTWIISSISFIMMYFLIAEIILIGG